MSECSTFYYGHIVLSRIRLRGNIGIDIRLSVKKDRFRRQWNIYTNIAPKSNPG